MNDYEYEEENLDDFMRTASSILSEESNPDKETMIETLKQHLSSISDNQNEIQSFYKTINLVIFDKKSKKIIHKEAFKLYPIIFSFNPNSSFYYIDFFLFSINQSISEENKSIFSYLSIIFSEVILSFYSDEKENNNLIKKEYLLEKNKKYKLYEKLLNYCNEKIKTYKKTEQSFGCLLLTELIEKCPIVKEPNYLDSLFKIISGYLEDRFFECKLDLLNCTISLIFTSEDKFKPYANICLFKVLDYLTDEEWMKRKLAINIVYTLIFYCREEIMTVKDNIVEFLNTLKEDPIEEIREVCIQTLKFIDENDKIEGEGEEEEESHQNIEQNIENDIEENKNVINDSNNNTNETKNRYDNINKNKNNNKNKINNNKPKSNTNNKAKEKKENNIKNNDDKLELKNENNPKKIGNFDYIYRTQNLNQIKKKANEDYIKKKLLKEKDFLEKKEKELNEKTKNNINFETNNNNVIHQNSYKPKQKPGKTIAKLIKEFNIPDSSNDNNNDKDKKENKNENSNNNENDLNSEEFNLALKGILQQINTIQEGQNKFLSMLNNLQRNIDDNYSDLNGRISALENYFIKNNNG